MSIKTDERPYLWLQITEPRPNGQSVKIEVERRNPYLADDYCIITVTNCEEVAELGLDKAQTIRVRDMLNRMLEEWHDGPRR